MKSFLGLSISYEDTGRISALLFDVIEEKSDLGSSTVDNLGGYFWAILKNLQK